LAVRRGRLGVGRWAEVLVLSSPNAAPPPLIRLVAVNTAAPALCWLRSVLCAPLPLSSLCLPLSAFSPKLGLAVHLFTPIFPPTSQVLIPHAFRLQHTTAPQHHTQHAAPTLCSTTCVPHSHTTTAPLHALSSLRESKCTGRCCFPLAAHSYGLGTASEHCIQRVRTQLLSSPLFPPVNRKWG
jgi:hypothetical protein